jgi:DNA-binding CsgD family transcriptional regulator
MVERSFTYFLSRLQLAPTFIAMNNSYSFSERELQVINLLLEGKSNKEIAQELGITVRTVEFHITNILAKVGVSSRAEAIVKLSETDLRESTGIAKDENPRESTVEKEEPPVQNVNDQTLNRRSGMNKRVSTIIIVVLVIFVFLCLFIFVWNYSPSKGSTHGSVGSPTEIETIPALVVTSRPSETPTPTLSPREKNLAQARQMVAQYDQAVKDEMQKGNFENSQDPKTGKERIIFKGDSQERILKLYDEMSHKLVDLNKQYLAYYIAEIQPTPYPPQVSEQENEDYYQSLVKKYQVLLDQLVKDGPTVQVFDPDDGIYYNRLVGDAYAQSEVMASAMETLRQAPDMARVDQPADADLIRKVLGQPDLQLTFVGVGSQANASWISTSIYEDQALNKYYVAIGMDVLAAIEPGSSPSVPAIEVKPIETVRQIAEKFIREHSPNYGKYQDQLTFEQGGKGDIYFFTWRLKDKDWSATDWKMMPPFLQIGMSADGKIATLIDTLDLYKE